MSLTKAQRLLLSSSLSVFLVGCGSPNYSQSDMHMTVEEADTTQPKKPEKIPALVKASPTAPVLSNTEDSATFDVVVTSVPVRDLLFALARDAGINMDIDDRVGGYVSISAIDQTLDAILERIGRQVEIRVERVGDAILITPDTPYRKYYQIDFLNVSRTYSSSATTGGVGDTGTASVSSSGSNDFWAGLEEAIGEILSVNQEVGESTGIQAEKLLSGEVAEGQAITNSEIKTPGGSNSYVLNSETGLLIVYAPERLQKEIQSLLDRSLSIAKRQVLLEATIVEVVLNNQYAQGIDWSVFNSLATEGLALYQGGTVGGAAAALEYITRAVEYTIPELSLDSALFLTVDADGNQTLIDENTLRAIGASYGLTTTQLNDIVTISSGDPVQAANLVAIALRDAYIINARAEAFSDPLNAVTEYTPEISTEVDEDTGLNTYTASGSYLVEEINENATSLSSGGLVPNNPQNGFFTAAYRQGDISAAVQLLDTFGDAKVLSSPRISVLNHQPALLRVVDQEVYFNFSVEESVSGETGLAVSREFTAEENVVDVGFSLNVLPQISGEGEIILNLKPAVTRVIDYRQAPVLEAFGGASGGTQNFVPITRVRELESIISLRDGEIAVLGGLLEDRTGDDSTSVPGLSRLPGIGALFERKNQATYKTEFVVFIRARVIGNPSVNGDYAGYRHLLPNSEFILRDTESTLLPPSQLKTR